MLTLTEVNKKKMEEVAEDLLGTCNDLSDSLEHFFGTSDLTGFDVELMGVLDDITMLCEECGWWCETGFLNDNQVCDQCEPENEDDED